MAHVQTPVGKDKVVVNGSMLNSASGAQMKLHAYHNWSGSPYGLFPNKFAKGDASEFVHKGEKPTDILGSKGVVGYAGTNQSGTPDTFDCAWLLAWSAPFPDSDEHNYKVYVEAGDIKKYPMGDIVWSDIQDKLDKASATCHYKDEYSGCEAFATIKDGSKNAVDLSARFVVNPI